MGISAWDEDWISIRNRFNRRDGGYDPVSSSELPLDHLPILVDGLRHALREPAVVEELRRTGQLERLPGEMIDLLALAAELVDTALRETGQNGGILAAALSVVSRTANLLNLALANTGMRSR